MEIIFGCCSNELPSSMSLLANSSFGPLMPTRSVAFVYIASRRGSTVRIIGLLAAMSSTLYLLRRSLTILTCFMMSFVTLWM
uniref:Uncharacterized protein n=1 Tax=Arundo donax TaxID=35708 RepID=A0A0A9A6Q7_ARUDO